MSSREHHCRVCGGPAFRRRRFNTRTTAKGYLRVWLCEADLEKIRELTELTQLDAVETHLPIDEVLDDILNESYEEKGWYPYVYGGLSGATLQRKRARRYEKRKKREARLLLHEGFDP